MGRGTMRSRGGSTWALRMQSTRAWAARWSTHRSFRRHRGKQPSRTEHDAAADIVYIRSDGGLQGGGHGRCGEIGQSDRCLLMLAAKMGNEEEERPQTSSHAAACRPAPRRSPPPPPPVSTIPATCQALRRCCASARLGVDPVRRIADAATPQRRSAPPCDSRSKPLSPRSRRHEKIGGRLAHQVSGGSGAEERPAAMGSSCSGELFLVEGIEQSFSAPLAASGSKGERTTYFVHHHAVSRLRRDPR
jgi:hypothetical protein